MSEAPETPEKEPDPGSPGEGAFGQPLGGEQPPKRRRAPRKRAAPIEPAEVAPAQELSTPPSPVVEPSTPPPPAPPPPPPPPQPIPPPPPRVEEVEAIPITRAETRGPAIEIPGTRHMPEPPPAPPPSAVPPVGATSGATAQPPPPPPPPPPIAPAETTPKPPSTFWVVVCHLSYLIPAFIPGLAVTLVIWAWRRKRDAHLDDQAKEALNFQLTYTGLTLILSATCILCVLVPIVWIVGAVLCAVAAVSAADGKRYRYPWILRLIK